MTTVTWTTTAAAQLAAIRDYIAITSEKYAEAVAVRIVSRADRLGDHPRLGGEVEAYADPTIRELIEYAYRILYRYDGGDVLIVSVVHGAPVLPRTPPD